MQKPRGRTGELVLDPNAASHKFSERFIHWGQLEQAFCYQPAKLMSVLGIYEDALWQILCALAWVDKWPSKTITVVKTTADKWFIMHPRDEAEFYSRPHGFDPQSRGVRK
jgi:hypothetical protein